MLAALIKSVSRQKIENAATVCQEGKLLNECTFTPSTKLSSVACCNSLRGLKLSEKMVCFKACVMIVVAKKQNKLKRAYLSL